MWGTPPIGLILYHGIGGADDTFLLILSTGSETRLLDLSAIKKQHMLHSVRCQSPFPSLVVGMYGYCAWRVMKDYTVLALGFPKGEGRVPAPPLTVGNDGQCLSGLCTAIVPHVSTLGVVV